MLTWEATLLVWERGKSAQRGPRQSGGSQAESLHKEESGEGAEHTRLKSYYHCKYVCEALLPRVHVATI